MRRWIGFVIVVLIVGAICHAAVVVATPRVIMNVAMKRVAGGGEGWRHAPRTTAASRAVVRPSPDLAYSACVYDLAEGPVVITMQPSADYWSLSLYSGASDNFFTRNDRESPGGVRILLVKKGAAPAAQDIEMVESPTVRGIALERRLAPSAAAFAAADVARRGDTCEAAGEPYSN